MHIDPNNKETKLLIKRGLLDKKPRQLILNPDFIQFQDKDLISNSFTHFEKKLITGYRFGIKWIKGFEFTIGRDYQIFIRNSENKILKINFKCFYGINKNEYHKQYAQIVDTLWDLYFWEITNDFFRKFQQNEVFTIGEVCFTKDELIIKVPAIIKEKEYKIPWDKVATQDYHTYFAIYSLDNPTDINRGYNYLEDWNTNILINLVRAILKFKQK